MFGKILTSIYKWQFYKGIYFYKTYSADNTRNRLKGQQVSDSQEVK